MARKKARKSVRRRSGGGRRGSAKQQPPYALIGATVLLAGAGAYLFWPRTAGAATPPPPPASLGSSSPTARQVASGHGNSAQTYAQQAASMNKNAATGAPLGGLTNDPTNGQLIDTSVGGLGSDASAASNAATNPFGALWSWVTGA